MPKHKVVIVGAGFAGLYAAKSLAKKDVEVTLIDKRNFHLFQPLLYQVATGGLSPGDIASPIRAIFKKQKNITVLQTSIEKINSKKKTIITGEKEIEYDTLIIATGVKHHYFGNDQWINDAPGLKSVEDALKIRMRIMQAFEKAELESDKTKKCEWQRFVIVGGGPTGVELAGALGELANQTLLGDFRNINPEETEIYLVEGAERILPTFSAKLSSKAKKSLEKLSVSVLTKTLVVDIDKSLVRLKNGDSEKVLNARTVLWAAGVKGSSVGELLQNENGVKLDPAGRVIVNSDLSIPGNKDIFVIGDLAHFETEEKEMLPGVAQVAMQQGRYMSQLILRRLKGQGIGPFKYKDKGNMAVIGRKAAVVQMAKLELSGWPAWLIWIFIHIAYLIEYDSKTKVMLQWAWNFFTRKRGARLITKMD
ncbi:MAG: NAD(P)/FAD-dependent oxidoreductase [Calditrichaeota bacterium]|nr:MAG: NAD(P)/FAD-dependent oxidoreductase [Calditrichota bacterium]MBL1205338.1 NAD(P)/FAD-dependent oxidoreductase [Calditrichota bacterium]NOG45167.1 NAD(P)/FAD-dependent oxidoreductase [Calditrichota bacterium]